LEPNLQANDGRNFSEAMPEIRENPGHLFLGAGSPLFHSKINILVGVSFEGFLGVFCLLVGTGGYPPSYPVFWNEYFSDRYPPGLWGIRT
jgi:hypothetical protein